MHLSARICLCTSGYKDDNLSMFDGPTTALLPILCILILKRKNPFTCSCGGGRKKKKKKILRLALLIVIFRVTAARQA